MIELEKNNVNDPISKPVRLGLKENWQQFTLLVVINAFVGGMVGLERSILPRIAEKEFHVAVKTAILSFIWNCKGTQQLFRR